MTTILHRPHLPNPIYYLPKLPTLHPPRIGVLLTDFKKFYVYFMKTTMLSFHASPVHIVPVYYIHYLQKWITRDNSIVYPLETSFPEINLTNNPRNPTKVAVCDGCKSNSNNRVCLPLTQIPQCIHNVPYAKRKYLSPIYLHTSLGWYKSFHRIPITYWSNGVF